MLGWVTVSWFNSRCQTQKFVEIYHSVNTGASWHTDYGLLLNSCHFAALFRLYSLEVTARANFSKF